MGGPCLALAGGSQLLPLTFPCARSYLDGTALTGPETRGWTTGAPPIPATPGLALNGVGGGGALANPGTRLPGTFAPWFAGTTETFLLDPS